MKLFLLKRRACIEDDVVRCGSLDFQSVHVGALSLHRLHVRPRLVAWKYKHTRRHFMKVFLLQRRACIADDVVRCGSLVFFCCGRGGRVADARLLLADAWRTRGGRAIQFAV